jgi:hypothetical protein
MEVYQAVYNSNDVVYAKDKRIKNAGATQLESLVEVIQLCQAKSDESKEDHP